MTGILDALAGLPLAHGIVGRADLPIPDWLFGWAAALVLVISFVALAILWPEPKLTRVRERALLGPAREGQAAGHPRLAVDAGLWRDLCGIGEFI